LFLTRGALPHDHLWGKFFARQDRSAYAIHVHAPPGFVFDETTTRVPWLFNARVLLPNPVAASRCVLSHTGPHTTASAW
jgi:hypothetical protein